VERSGIIYDASWALTPARRVVRSPKPQALLGFRVKAGILALERGRIRRAGLSSPFQKLEIHGPGLRPSLAVLRKPLFLLGNALLVLSLGGIFLTMYPVLRTQIAYRAVKIASTNPTETRGYFNDILQGQPAVTPVDAPDPSFSIVVPKIDAAAKIVANVDPANKAEYDRMLKQGVAHAAGTGFPGGGGVIWLFAHSASAPWDIVRYNAVFYLLAELEPGDSVIVFFSGKRFNYRVADKKIIESHDTSFLKEQIGETLVLQTCWPPGTISKRIIVLAKPA